MYCNIRFNLKCSKFSILTLILWNVFLSHCNWNNTETKFMLRNEKMFHIKMKQSLIVDAMMITLICILFPISKFKQQTADMRNALYVQRMRFGVIIKLFFISQFIFFQEHNFKHFSCLYYVIFVVIFADKFWRERICRLFPIKIIYRLLLLQLQLKYLESILSFFPHFFFFVRRRFFSWP